MPASQHASMPGDTTQAYISVTVRIMSAHRGGNTSSRQRHTAHLQSAPEVAAELPPETVPEAPEPQQPPPEPAAAPAPQHARELAPERTLEPAPELAAVPAPICSEVPPKLRC